MNDDQFTPDGMTAPPWHCEIDALLDGEAVDTQALRTALDDRAAREYFLDALCLRQFAHDMGPARFVAPGTPRRPLVGAVRWLAAALILIIGGSVGYLQGQRSHAPVLAPRSVEVVLEDVPPAAPQPTRLIRFEPGVNWTSDTRSH